MTAKTTEAAAGGHHAMVGQAGVVGCTHDLTDGSGRARSTGYRRQIAIRDDPPGGHPSEREQHSCGERRPGHGR